jgi:hypothetical protein
MRSLKTPVESKYRAVNADDCKNDFVMIERRTVDYRTVHEPTKIYRKDSDICGLQFRSVGQTLLMSAHLYFNFKLP